MSLLAAVDLNGLLQFIFTLFTLAAFLLLYLVRNSASNYFLSSDESDDTVLDWYSSSPPSTATSSSTEVTISNRNSANMGDEGLLEEACVVCGSLTKKYCAGCKVVKYCSQVCQKTHWKLHRSKCKSLQSRIKLSGGSCNINNRARKILFPYEEFVELFNWNKPGFPPCGLLNCGNRNSASNCFLSSDESDDTVLDWYSSSPSSVATFSNQNSAHMGNEGLAEEACVVCGSLTKKYCARCRRVKYCSQVCQKSHWGSGHKSKCKDSINGRITRIVNKRSELGSATLINDLSRGAQVMQNTNDQNLEKGVDISNTNNPDAAPGMPPPRAPQPQRPGTFQERMEDKMDYLIHSLNINPYPGPEWRTRTPVHNPCGGACGGAAAGDDKDDEMKFVIGLVGFVSLFFFGFRIFMCLSKNMFFFKFLE